MIRPMERRMTDRRTRALRGRRHRRCTHRRGVRRHQLPGARSRCGPARRGCRRGGRVVERRPGAHEQEARDHGAQQLAPRARARRAVETYAEEAQPALQRGAATSARERAEHAFDPATGLYDERYFAVLVQQQFAAARRSLRPISVVIFELDALADTPTVEHDRALTVVGDVVRRTFRESDSACRLGDVMVGVILEDTPEAGGVWAAERVRGTLLASPIGDALTVSAGVACYAEPHARRGRARATGRPGPRRGPTPRRRPRRSRPRGLSAAHPRAPNARA